MSTYYIDCCTGLKIGSYGTLGEAQSKAQSLAEEYMATDPATLSIQSTPVLYVVIKTSNTTYISSGINFNNSNQYIDKKWEIIELQSPNV